MQQERNKAETNNRKLKRGRKGREEKEKWKRRL